MQTLRNDVIPPVVGGTGVDAQVGGETAASIDAANFLGHRLFLVIGAVLILSFLLLMVVFRSLVLPLKAVIMNLLSVGAAYGVMVAVFQWGWAGRIIGIGETGPIDPWIPVALFVVLFGLSMDYEVFLLSRIREEWLRTHDNSLSVADGIAVTGRIITAAAAIMFCVFASFVIKDPLHILKVFGLGLATAVLVDATHRAHDARPVDHGDPRPGQLVDARLDGPFHPADRRGGDAHGADAAATGARRPDHRVEAIRPASLDAVQNEDRRDHVRVPQPRARRAAGRDGGVPR